MKPRNSKIDQGGPREASQTPGISGSPVLFRAAGLGLGTAVCVLIMLGASGPDTDQEQDSRQKIEAMSPSEREQLKRNYEKYQQLTDEEKRRYRKIHEATRNQPDLNRVMHSYNEWVNTLSPWEQEDLRKAGTTQERMELIRKYRSHGNRSNHRGGNRKNIEMLKMLEIDPRVTFLWIHSPPPELFKEVVGIIEKSLPEPVKYPRPKNQMSDFDRSMAVFKAAVPLRNRRRPDNENRSDWPPPEVVTSIHKLLDDQKYSFRNSDDQRNFRSLSREDDRKRMLTSVFLVKGLLDQLVGTLKQELDQFNPPDDELQKFFETSLDSKTQDYLMKYPPEELLEKLKSMYFREHMPAELKKKLRSQAVEFNQLMGELELKGAGPDGPFRGGLRDRMQDMKNRRPDGPKDRGGRPARGRNPGEAPPRLPREEPDA
tara:strand:+ start:3345 stop:4631 length:1287 start_codon:yes stop_codon:yes gene_type:complete